MSIARVARRLTLGLGLASLLLAGAPAFAQDDEKNWGFEAGVDHASIYLFRGLDVLADEPVDYGHASFYWGGLSVYWWGYQGDIGEDGPDYFENDFGVDYTIAGAAGYVTMGAVIYTYADPEDFDDTTEVYAIAGLDIPLSPTLSVFYDIDLYDGAYASLGISHSVELGNGFTITPAASYGYSMGWTERAFGFERSNNPNDVLLGVDLGWSAGVFSIHAMAQKSIALQGLDTVGQGDEKIYTVGASFSF